MARRSLPPYPTSGDWKQWALQVVEYLASRDESESENLPQTVQLSHQIPPGPYRALTNGLLMYDAALGVPVYSKDGSWNQFTAQGDLNYLVTDDAGNGTVVDDINQTDFTGQTGAIGQCAQCPVATNTSFYHKGVQYLYTGPTPASYGAGCPDTMTEDYLIPVGVGTFLALSDTPDDYTGFAGYWPRVSPGEDAIIFDEIEEADITDLDRIRWRGNWVQQTYQENDMVLGDANWLMIANKTTADVAPPRPEGNPQWTLPDVPVWDTPYPAFNGVVRSGVEFDIQEPIQYQAVQVWAPALDAAINYVLFVYSYTTGGDGSDLTVIQTPEPLLLEDEWTTVTLSSGLLQKDQTLGIFIDALNSGGDTLVNGGWGRGANSNDTLVDPGSGSFGSNNANTLLRLNYIDLDAVDRTLELQGIIAGSTIQLAQTNDASRSFTFTINAAGIDATTHISFQDVTLADTGPNGEPIVGEPCSITITIPIPQPTDYVEQVGAITNPTWGIARGILSLNGEQQVGVDANAYGVRLLADTYVVSPDWDIANAIGTGGGSSAGGGGASTFTELGDTPSDYGGLAQQIMRVNLAETGLEARPQGVQAHSDQDTYAFDDIVSFEGALYHCIVPHSAQPFSLVNWSPASQPVGSGVTLSYRWSNLVTGDPGSGQFAITDPMANPTNTLRISDLTDTGIDVSAFWDNIQGGDYIAFVEDTGGAESGVWVATGPSVDQTTHFDIPVNWVANTGEPEDGRKGFAFIIQNPDARVPPGGADGQVLSKASTADYDTEWTFPSGNADPSTVGMVAAFPTATVPTGWLVCDGSTFDTGAYPQLGVYLGGDTLPDMRDMFLKGATPDLPGATGGEKETTLDESNIPAHTHTVDPPSTNTNTTGSHSHTVSQVGGLQLPASGGATTVQVSGRSNVTSSTDGSHSHSVNIAQFNSGSFGDGQPFANEPQHYVVVWAIRAVPTDPNDPAGATSFLELTDTPISYVGQTGLVPVVNGTEDGLEFGEPGRKNFIELDDTPADYTGQASKVTAVKGDETGLEFVDLPPTIANATVGDTFPVAPAAGDLHYKTGAYVGLYIWYDDGDSSQWVQTNGGGLDPEPSNPPGLISYFATATAPTGWLVADGAAISRTEYATLFDAIGTLHGEGDGSTTFNVPDLRGEFLRGVDDGTRGLDPGAPRVVGGKQTTAMVRLTDTVTTYMASGTPTGSNDLFRRTSSSNPKGAASSGSGYYVTGLEFDNAHITATSTENRPTNVAMLPCIKI